MDKKEAVQVFSVLAVLVGMIVSYLPPTTNAAAIFGIVTMFLGYAIRDLFGDDKKVPLPPQGTDVTAAAPGVAVDENPK